MSGNPWIRKGAVGSSTGLNGSDVAFPYPQRISGKPFVTLTADPNGDADFGPFTPGTESYGFFEGMTQAIISNLPLHAKPGRYVLSPSLSFEESADAFVNTLYQLPLIGSGTSANQALAATLEIISTPSFDEQYSSSPNATAIIDASNVTPLSGNVRQYIMGVPAGTGWQGAVPSALTLYLKGLKFLSPGGNIGAVWAPQLLGCRFEGVSCIGSGGASSTNQYGSGFCVQPYLNNLGTFNNVLVLGMYNGIEIWTTDHIVFSNLNVTHCKNAVEFWGGGAHAAVFYHLDVGGCGITLNAANATTYTPLVVFQYDNEVAPTGGEIPAFQYDIYDPNSLLCGQMLSHNIYTEISSDWQTISTYGGSRFHVLYEAGGPTVGVWGPPTQGSALSTNYQTASATDVCTGLGALMRSAWTGMIKVWGTVSASNSSGTNAFILKVWRNTGGTIPSQGSAPGGGDTMVGEFYEWSGSANATQGYPYSLLDQSLTPGGTYAYYVTVQVSGGTLTISGANNQSNLILDRVDVG